MAYARSYVWDPMGNRLQQWDSGVLTSGTFNKANQQTLITPATGAPTTQSFGNVGNMTLESTGAALVSSTWSPENRLVSYVDSKGDSVSSAYSDDGLRRQRTSNGVTTDLTYDESVLLLETNTSGGLVARYTNFPEIWGGLVSQSRSGVSSFFGFDSQTSARILVSFAGLVTDAKSWKAFGEPIQPGSGTITPYGYVAGAAYYMEFVDLFNAWHRWPKPSTGQWRSVDPVGYRAGDPNLRRYVGNNPVSNADAVGLWCYQLPTGNCVGTTCQGDPNCPSLYRPRGCQGVVYVCFRSILHGFANHEFFWIHYPCGSRDNDIFVGYGPEQKGVVWPEIPDDRLAVNDGTAHCHRSNCTPECVIGVGKQIAPSCRWDPKGYFPALGKCDCHDFANDARDQCNCDHNFHGFSPTPIVPTKRPWWDL